MVGPVATAVLRRYGLLWPPNAHFHAPLLDAAKGGSLLTGIGGDEMLAEGATTQALAVVTGTRRPERRDVLRLAWALAPRPLRRSVTLRRDPPAFPWLRTRSLEAALRALADQSVREPLRRRAQVEWRLGFRYLTVGRESLSLLAADEQVEFHTRCSTGGSPPPWRNCRGCSGTRTERR